MRYLTVEQILLIHSMIVDESGGLHGVRRIEELESAAALPRQTAFGQDLYPDVFSKAAAYTRTIIMNHPFLDGNKRTGISAGIIFLEDNGHTFKAKEGEIQTFAVSVVTEKLPVDAIAAWFRDHAR